MERISKATMLLALVVVVGGAILVTAIDPVMGFDHEIGVPYITHQVITMLVGATMAAVLSKRN